MTSYFLDTSVIIDYLKGKEGTVSAINSLRGDLSSSYFCLAELYEGVYRSTNRAEHEEKIIIFFSGLSRIYGLNAKTVKKFGEIRAKLKQKGQIIEDMDLFIAATCIVNSATLITHNTKHFERVEGLKLYEWRK